MVKNMDIVAAEVARVAREEVDLWLAVEVELSVK